MLGAVVADMVSHGIDGFVIEMEGRLIYQQYAPGNLGTSCNAVPFLKL